MLDTECNMMESDEQKKQRGIDLQYLKHAYILAMQSPDPSTQNAAIIVRDNSVFSLSSSNVIGSGFNGFTRGMEDYPGVLERPLKYMLIDHGETASIYDAACLGNSTCGGIMYAPWFACDKCGIAVVKAGIVEVIGSTWPEKFWRQSRDNGKDNKRDWYEGIRLALEMFDRAGVKYRWVEGPIEGVKVRFDGKLRKLI